MSIPAALGLIIEKLLALLPLFLELEIRRLKLILTILDVYHNNNSDAFNDNAVCLNTKQLNFC